MSQANLIGLPSCAFSGPDRRPEEEGGRARQGVHHRGGRHRRGGEEAVGGRLHQQGREDQVLHQVRAAQGGHCQREGRAAGEGDD